MRISTAAFALVALLPVAGECDQTYRVYTQHPRLWLDARRLRLLRRERQRDSIRWKQIDLLVKSQQSLPEEPLVWALEYQAAQREDPGVQAVAWAMKRAALAAAPDAAELRLLAIVFDWCYPLLGEAERTKLAARMARGVGKISPQRDLRSFSSAVLVAVALADDWPGSEHELTELFEKKWRQDFLPALLDGRGLGGLAETAAFLEMCHVVRDNLNLDLWEQARVFFRQFPVSILLGYYPAPLTIEGHRFRQPVTLGRASAEAARQAELARLVELLTVAYESNSVETQFLQGWITHDIYRLRTYFGAPYELLWMNPYLPGLSYYNAPLYLHDELGGRLLARSSWDDDATWIGYLDGELRLFADGKPTPIDPQTQTAPIVFPHLAVVVARGEGSFEARLAEGQNVFVIGLEAGRTYWVKIGEGGFGPRAAGKGGILALKVEPGVQTAIELRTADPNPPPPTLEKRSRKRGPL